MGNIFIKNRSGLVLVTVLWVVVLLIVIVAVVGRNSRVDTKLCIYDIDSLRCRWACQAGVETTAAILNDDDKASDCLTDLWADSEDDLNDVELQDCLFTVKVYDESSKLNINTVTKNQLLSLPDMTEEIAAAIIDWRDSDDNPSVGGAEAGYYENMRYRYSIRNGNLRTIRELLLVKGVTASLLYGPPVTQSLDIEEQDDVNKGWIWYLSCYSYDKNKDAEEEERVNINDASEEQLQSSLSVKKSHAKWIVDNRPKDGYKSIADLINKNSPKKSSDEDGDEAQQIDLETFDNIADKITITGDERIAGRVNINTAQRTVLTAVLGGGDTGKQLANNIITYRESLFVGMESIAEIMNVEGITIDRFKGIANSITTRSDVYTVHSDARADRGGPDGFTLKTEAVIDRSSTPYTILYWYQKS
ncbi:hypothetical protein ACFL3G_04190 [Planctomycetota bacterium]